ncbi:MAG: ferrochelatase [Streptococcus mutans]|uniref:ferrochelatase n=1 Tax=Streptococcus mutans TaxID=1309 RepID=UPI0002F9E905|nr:ferrochelatase [Streptococcus mutans]
MSQQKIGVLLVNLGTPEHPTAPAIRKFLKPFLADSRVIDYPKFLWKPILYSFILPFRPRKVKPLYQHVWTNEGSPLYANTIGQEKALQAHFDQSEHGVLVRATMAYSKPSISDVVDEFLKEKVAKMIVLPLFPQYSSTTTAAIFDAFAQSLKKKKDIPPFDFIHHYYERPSYIQALAQTIHLQENEHLLFSFHGIPQRYVIEGDYYTEHCQQTAQLIAVAAGLSEEQWQVSYQSRFGSEEWTRPYTDETLIHLPKQGKKKIAVICPGFAADCLETLEEIDITNRKHFMAAGGQAYRYIPALNASPAHIQLLAELISERL